MPINENGVSTTNLRGQFAYEEYKSPFSGKLRVQWDYRDMAGHLHSGIAVSVEAAVNAASRFGYKEAREV